MINKVINLIKKHSEITDYLLTLVEKKSSELYFVRKEIETVRSNNETSLKAEIHIVHGETLGTATFTVSPAFTDEDIENNLLKAIQIANASSGPIWTLLEEGKGDYQSESTIKDYDPFKLANLYAEASFAAIEDPNASLNASEYFVTKTQTRLVSSRGLDKKQVSYKIFIEQIPTYTKDGKSVEIYESYTEYTVDTKAFAEKVKLSMIDVKARFEAIKPESKLEGRVLLRPTDAVEIFDSIGGDLTYHALFQKINKYSKGDTLQTGDDCDLLDITMTNKLYGHNIGNFDHLGTDLEPVKVVEKGKAIEITGDINFAQYLGSNKATGFLPGIKVEAGSYSIEQLKSVPHLEVATMSGIQVSLMDDYIGGEVRLAYYYDGKTVTPVTGISISAKLSDVLSTMKMANTTVAIGRNEIPSLFSFDKVKIQ